MDIRNTALGDQRPSLDAACSNDDVREAAALGYRASIIDGAACLVIPRNVMSERMRAIADGLAGKFSAAPVRSSPKAPLRLVERIMAAQNAPEAEVQALQEEVVGARPAIAASAEFDEVVAQVKDLDKGPVTTEWTGPEAYAPKARQKGNKLPEAAIDEVRTAALASFSEEASARIAKAAARSGWDDRLKSMHLSLVSLSADAPRMVAQDPALADRILAMAQAVFEALDAYVGPGLSHVRVTSADRIGSSEFSFHPAA